MWALLVSLWAAVGTDAVGQWLDPSDAEAKRSDRPGKAAAWPFLVPALSLGAVWPWLLDGAPWLATLFAMTAAALAFLAARRARTQRRAAIGFLAGWSIGLATATAARLHAPADISLAQTAMLAILPAAVLGVAAQVMLGRGIGVSVALIWAFCGLAMTTMVLSPLTAITATLGIAVMASVLIRAAS